MNQTFKHVLSDQEIDELKQRNKVRIKQAQEKLGHKWLLSRTRLAQPQNVAQIRKTKT